MPSQHGPVKGLLRASHRKFNIKVNIILTGIVTAGKARWQVYVSLEKRKAKHDVPLLTYRSLVSVITEIIRNRPPGSRGQGGSVTFFASKRSSLLTEEK